MRRHCNQRHQGVVLEVARGLALGPHEHEGLCPLPGDLEDLGPQPELHGDLLQPPVRADDDLSLGRVQALKGRQNRILHIQGETQAVKHERDAGSQALKRCRQPRAADPGTGSSR